MAMPKKKLSSTRGKRRRSENDKLTRQAVAICANCGVTNAPHTVCAKCGYYKGQKVT